ncbi:serine/threonine-protein kinase pats1 [Mizuhopecten yessoensis]|uniref:Serine/threonine-protein kinase pats1 n=2 Tax=Mizuhopecten yessoensis TaxID=6573 RepID=A0A210QVN0_MIZYE|nr:serine/threonine-protein kinase pats1 [Mizuhopecten yessoensis]
MYGDGEIETGRQRLKRIIDRYRKDAGQPSEDKPAPHHDREEGSTSLPDQLTATLNAPTVGAPVLSARKKTGIKETLKQFFSKLSYGGQVREVQEEAILQAQRRRHYSSSEDKHKEIPREQRDVIKAVMSTEIDVDGAEEVKGYVTIYDFGGEKVFYNTHHCFMSSNMVFVLVFDVDMCLDPRRQKDGYERIEFWLRAIATYAIDRAAHGKGTPPVILVGSHMDLVSENEEEQDRMFASVLEKLYEKHELREIMNTHVRDMFPIANLNDSTKNADVYQRVWNKIIEIAPLQSQWMKPVPARWVALEHELVTMKHTGRVILTYADLLEINSNSTVPLPEYDIVNFLWKLKFSGSFLCFAIHSKRPFVVLQAQWMMHAFRAIITDPKFTTKLTTKQRLQWSDYEKSGILTVDFIRELWGRYKNSGFLEEEETLYIALETLGLLSKPLSVDSEVNYFVVPSILRTADPEIIQSVLDDPDTVITVALCLKFDNPFIPQAVWDKMIAACVHRFQRLEEPGLDGSTFIKRGFACLAVDCLWNMIINCCKNVMKVTMFKKDTDKSVPAGAGINLRIILELLLERILKLNHQSHLRYHFYLHNDYRFTADEKMVNVNDLGETPRLQCYSSHGCKWMEREDLFIWFREPYPKTKKTHDRLVGMAKELPDRQLSLKEIGRVSRYIGKAYLTFFTELNCPVVLVEQEMEEHRHLAFRSRMTKILIHFLKTQPCTGFLAIANAMSRHGMDPSKLQNVLDIDKKTVLNDDTLLGKQLSVSDVRIIADRVDVKSYFNLFLELGFTPTKLDEFDDHYRNKSSREKITALLKEFIKETRPRPTVNEILLAMQECDMDTESLIRALKPS